MISFKKNLILLIFGLSMLTLSSCQPLTRLERNEIISANQMLATPIIVALEEYHADKEDFPIDLSSLVPKYLDEVPKPTTNEQFSYDLYEARGGYILGFDIDEQSGCGYTPRFGWDCGFGH